MTFLGTRPSERLSMFVRNTCDVLVFLSVSLWLTDVWMPWLFECIVDGKHVLTFISMFVILKVS